MAVECMALVMGQEVDFQMMVPQMSATEILDKENLHSWYNLQSTNDKCYLCDGLSLFSDNIEDCRLKSIRRERRISVLDIKDLFKKFKLLERAPAKTVIPEHQEIIMLLSLCYLNVTDSTVYDTMKPRC